MIIRVRNEEGLYSKGGVFPKFTKKGKTWSSLGYLKNHLTQVPIKDLYRIYENSTIIIVDDENNYETQEVEMKEYLKNFTIEVATKNKEKEIASLKTRKRIIQESIMKLNQELIQIDRKLGEF